MKTISCLIAVLLGVSLAKAGEHVLDDNFRLIFLAEETHAMCRLDESTEAVVEAACNSRKVYWNALTELGYCFDKGEQTWYKLPFAEDGFHCAEG